MTVNVNSDVEIWREAWDVLLRNMSPSKLARFWAGRETGRGDYLRWRDELFGDQTVDDLYVAIEAFQSAGKPVEKD
jgi:hypothetical protein